MNQILKETDGTKVKSGKYKSIIGVEFDVHLSMEHKRSK